MTIKDDMLSLVGIQEQFFHDLGRYVQALPTPATVPEMATDTKITELEKSGDEAEKIVFTPTVKDYQFQVNVMNKPEGVTSEHGFIILARRDLGDKVIEEIQYKGKELG